MPSSSAPSSSSTSLHDLTTAQRGGGRARLEKRVQAARDDARAWTATAPNGARLGAYFTSYGMASLTAPTARGFTLADYSVLLEEWNVPGVHPPSDVGSDHAVLWARSVTLAVLRDLRRGGHLS